VPITVGGIRRCVKNNRARWNSGCSPRKRERHSISGVPGTESRAEGGVLNVLDSILLHARMGAVTSSRIGGNNLRETVRAEVQQARLLIVLGARTHLKAPYALCCVKQCNRNRIRRSVRVGSHSLGARSDRDSDLAAIGRIVQGAKMASVAS